MDLGQRNEYWICMYAVIKADDIWYRWRFCETSMIFYSILGRYYFHERYSVGQWMEAAQAYAIFGLIL
jgi:hypothetical protein